MKKLIDKIQKEATVIDNRVIKVDHFINHMLDTKLLNEIGKEFAETFSDVTKILTIETSGIAFSVATAFHLNNVPVVFAKKQKSLVTGKTNYSTKVHSFTKNTESIVTVSKNFISEDDKILIIDDFLAYGNAATGLIDLVEQANATLVGLGIVIEKAFQDGRKRIEKKGYKVHTLARIKKIKNNKLFF